VTPSDSLTQPQPARRLSGLLCGLLATLFVLSLPLAFIGNNVRWVTLDPETYRAGFERYSTTARTGLPPEELGLIAQGFIAYFKGAPSLFNPTVALRGQRRPLFNERELAHMADVQQAMQFTFRLGLAATIYALLYPAALLIARRSAALRNLGRRLIWGALLTVAILVLVGGLSLLDFEDLFIRFHQVAFQNDLWMLNPRTDYLLILFPEGFWLDITLKLAVLAAGEALLTGIVGALLIRQARRP
jgi:integral membrane protein (TIGR01906 family)